MSEKKQYTIVIQNTYHQNINSVEPEFWKKKKLEQMNEQEWELLCDGCGKCCLNKLESGGKIYFTCTGNLIVTIREIMF